MSLRNSKMPTQMYVMQQLKHFQLNLGKMYYNGCNLNQINL